MAQFDVAVRPQRHKQAPTNSAYEYYMQNPDISARLSGLMYCSVTMPFCYHAVHKRNAYCSV